MRKGASQENLSVVPEGGDLAGREGGVSALPAPRGPQRGHPAGAGCPPSPRDSVAGKVVYLLPGAQFDNSSLMATVSRAQIPDCDHVPLWNKVE